MRRDLIGEFERRARRELSLPGAESSRSVRDDVLRVIAGRTPRELVHERFLRTVRRLTAASAAVLAVVATAALLVGGPAEEGAARDAVGRLDGGPVASLTTGLPSVLDSSLDEFYGEYADPDTILVSLFVQEWMP